MRSSRHPFLPDIQKRRETELPPFFRHANVSQVVPLSIVSGPVSYPGEPRGFCFTSSYSSLSIKHLPEAASHVQH